MVQARLSKRFKDSEWSERAAASSEFEGYVTFAIFPISTTARGFQR